MTHQGEKQNKTTNAVVFINLSVFYVFWLCSFFILELFLQFLIKICIYAKPSPWGSDIYMKVPIVGTLFTEIKDFTVKIV